MLPLTSFRPFSSRIQQIIATNDGYGRRFTSNGQGEMSKSTSQYVFEQHVHSSKKAPSSNSSYSLNTAAPIIPMTPRRKESRKWSEFPSSSITHDRNPDTINSSTATISDTATTLESIGAKSGDLYKVMAKGVKDMLLT